MVILFIFPLWPWSLTSASRIYRTRFMLGSCIFQFLKGGKMGIFKSLNFNFHTTKTNKTSYETKLKHLEKLFWGLCATTKDLKASLKWYHEPWHENLRREGHWFETPWRRWRVDLTKVVQENKQKHTCEVLTVSSCCQESFCSLKETKNIEIQRFEDSPKKSFWDMKNADHWFD